MVKGLRIYIRPGVAEASDGCDKFYSRRADGPFYLWWYEERAAQWRSTRMRSSDLSTRELSVSAWKKVPSDLQQSLVEHYQE
jgi:hypothetical protein